MTREVLYLTYTRLETIFFLVETIDQKKNPDILYPVI